MGRRREGSKRGKRKTFISYLYRFGSIVVKLSPLNMD